MICIGENVTKNTNVATTEELPVLIPQSHFKEADQQGPNIRDRTPSTCHPVHGLYYFYTVRSSFVILEIVYNLVLLTFAYCRPTCSKEEEAYNSR